MKDKTINFSGEDFEIVFILFWFHKALSGVRRGLEMILSHMASSCFDMSPYRSIWAQHCTGTTNWPNTIQCLGPEDMMSLGIKSFATEGVGTSIFQEFGRSFLDMP